MDRNQLLVRATPAFLGGNQVLNCDASYISRAWRERKLQNDDLRNFVVFTKARLCLILDYYSRQYCLLVSSLLRFLAWESENTETTQ